MAMSQTMDRMDNKLVTPSEIEVLLGRSLSLISQPLGLMRSS